MSGAAFLPILIALLAARRKRHRRAARYFSGFGRGSPWNPTTLLAAFGLGVGAYEVWRSRSAGAASTTTVGDDPPRTGDEKPPPLPPTGAAAGPAPVAAMPAGLQRLVQLMVAAAKADGDLGQQEYALLVTEARAIGAAELVQAELEHPRPLVEIVAGIRDPAHKREVYLLAYGIIRADEAVTGAERAWLARLASLLALDRETVERLEQETNERIDSVSENEG